MDRAGSAREKAGCGEERGKAGQFHIHNSYIFLCCVPFCHEHTLNLSGAPIE
jgi:hypothetical protein